MSDDYAQFIRERISELRAKRGLSKRRLSAAINKSFTYLQDLECKQTLPSMAAFLDICACLGVTPEEFFSGADKNYYEQHLLAGELERLLTKEEMRSLYRALKNLDQKRLRVIRQFLADIANPAHG